MSSILIVGGTGNISWNLASIASVLGYEVTVLTRGSLLTGRRWLPNAIHSLVGDIRDVVAVDALLADKKFDTVVDFLCFNEDQARIAVDLFKGRARQYIFISTTAIYSRAGHDLPFTESHISKDLSWQYAKDKASAEAVFLRACDKDRFPVTIVRPGHTYDTVLPVAVGPADWTVPARILEGKPIVIHGDGTSLWTLTHADDFCRGLIGLIGLREAIGESFHITSDEWLTWNEISIGMVEALGIRTAQFAYVSSRAVNRINPYYGAGIIGHKMWCDIYDNSNIRRAVPGWTATTNFKEGLARSVQWYLANPAAQKIRRDFDEFLDQLVSVAEVITYSLQGERC